jgi:hypothetical protein
VSSNWQQIVYNLNQALTKPIRPVLPISSIGRPGGLYYQQWATSVLREQNGGGNVVQNLMIRPFNGSGGLGRPFQFDAVCRRADGSLLFNEFKGSPLATLRRNQTAGHPLFRKR